jgi:hypothetical protein
MASEDSAFWSSDTGVAWQPAHWCAKPPAPPHHIYASGMHLSMFFNYRRKHRSSGSEKVQNLTPSLSLTEHRAPIIIQNPSGLSGSIRLSTLICTKSFHANVERIQSKYLGVFLTQDTCNEVLLRRFWKKSLYPLEMWKSCHWVFRVAAETLKCLPRERWTLMLHPSKQCRYTWLGLGRPIWLLWLGVRGRIFQVYSSSGAHHDVLTSEGNWHEGVPQDAPSSIPPLFSCGSLFYWLVMPRNPPQHSLFWPVAQSLIRLYHQTSQ